MFYLLQLPIKTTLYSMHYEKKWCSKIYLQKIYKWHTLFLYNILLSACFFLEWDEVVGIGGSQRRTYKFYTPLGVDTISGAYIAGTVEFIFIDKEEINIFLKHFWMIQMEKQMIEHWCMFLNLHSFIAVGMVSLGNHK